MNSFVRALFYAGIAAAVSSLALLSSASEPQHHGHGSGDVSHFERVSERLELTEAQRQTLRGPFEDAFDTLQELHRLHEVIDAELTDSQKKELAGMVHEMLGGGARGAHP